ncbi:hypothetical protein TNIN_199891 [Trichonephila inaurata madagascariensis]|uniref:DUF5641 domain-containing protein n=1 Tax=Trichonephila inaurata madagascariensis TaxID=2747483 RepID=A0A8X6XQX6_9ARAC|nr:hypothetical protein TNIN_199891 [Trichonephila inaurata madagascariensis]
MKVGEIVLVENPNKNRLYWPLAKVLELLPEIQPKELPIAAVDVEKIPESSTSSRVPVACTNQVNPCYG